MINSGVTVATSGQKVKPRVKKSTSQKKLDNSNLTPEMYEDRPEMDEHTPEVYEDEQ